MTQREPKQYSVYQKAPVGDGRMQWVGTHRLPISSALRMFYMVRAQGQRVLIRLDGEKGPSYAD